MLVQYIKNKRGQKIGTVVALSKYAIGWSKCNIKLDKFDKNIGIDIAKVRAKESNILPPKVLIPTLNHMKNRAERYFKQPQKQKLERSLTNLLSLPKYIRVP